jgi:hypothetical protein
VAGQRLYLLTDLLTRLVGTGETPRDAENGRRARNQVSEMSRDAGDAQDARRMAHNPEVEGSNPSPATKARGSFSNRERAFCLCSAFAQADLLETREPPMISSARMVATWRSASTLVWTYCLW